MKRSTAIGHLVETGEVSSEQLKFRGTDIGRPIEELWVAGDLLGEAETVDAGSVVLVLDVPADEAPWAGDQPRGRVGRRAAPAAPAVVLLAAWVAGMRVVSLTK